MNSFRIFVFGKSFVTVTLSEELKGDFTALGLIILYNYALVWFPISFLLLLCIGSKTGISLQNTTEIFHFGRLIQMERKRENQSVLFSFTL